MLAVDQNDYQVRVWQLRTIYQHEVITVDYGGAYKLNCWIRLSQQQQRRIREHFTHMLFPPEWPHTQDGQITEKRTGEYAVASRNIYDTLTGLAKSDDSDEDNPDTTVTMEDNRDCNGSREIEQRGDNMAPITDWARSDEAPPEWRIKTIPLTFDATINAVDETLERVARKIHPNSFADKLTVLRSRHILTSIFRNHDKRGELLYTTLYIKSVSMMTLYT